jgi:hypothetical protein
MVSGSNDGQMKVSMRGTSIREKKREKASISGQMAAFMRENGKIMTSKGKGLTIGMTGECKLFIV